MKQFRRVIQYLEEDNRSEKWDELDAGQRRDHPQPDLARGESS